MKRYLHLLAAVALAGTMVALAPGSAAAQRGGVEIWSQSCGACHRPQPANRYSAEQWRIIVQHMRQQARMLDSDAQAVLEFLQSAARQAAQDEDRDALPPALPAVDARVSPARLSAAERQRVEQYIRQHRARNEGRP